MIVEHPDDGTPSLASFIEVTYTLLRVMAGDEVTRELLESVRLAVRACVLDTNVIYSELRYALRKQRPTALMTAGRIGGVRLFATVTVGDEVPEHLGEYMGKYGIDVEIAKQYWEEQYRPLIHFVDPSHLPPLSARVLALQKRDRDDLGTGQLIELIQPHAALSRDKDLAAFSVLTHDTALVTTAYRDRAIRDAAVIGLHLGGGVVLTLVGPAFQGIYKAISMMDGRLRGFLGLAVVAAFGVLIFNPSSRTWAKEQLNQSVHLIQQGALAAGQFSQAAASAEERLRLVQREGTALQTAHAYVAVVLAVAPGPLRVSEITRRMEELGYKPRGEHPERYVASILRKDPNLFEKVDRLGWQFRASHSASLS